MNKESYKQADDDKTFTNTGCVALRCGTATQRSASGVNEPKVARTPRRNPDS